MPRLPTADQLATVSNIASIIVWVITVLLRILERITVEQATVGFVVACALMLCSIVARWRVKKVQYRKV